MAESAATILALVHSKGSFEEYAVLILAYLNAEREADAALQSGPLPRQASLLNDILYAATFVWV